MKKWYREHTTIALLLGCAFALGATIIGIAIDSTFLKALGFLTLTVGGMTYVLYLGTQ